MARKFFHYRYEKASPSIGKTLFQFLVATDHMVVIEEIHFVLKGSTGASQAPLFYFLKQDDAGSGGTPFASGALVEREPGYAGSLALTGITDPSSEPTLTAANGKGHIMSGHQQNPFDFRSPQGPMYMQSDQRWGLFFDSGSTPDLEINVYGEE